MHDHTVMIAAAAKRRWPGRSASTSRSKSEPARAHGWKMATGYIFKRAKGRNEGHVCNRGSIVLSWHIH
jgi:hypothetical protein